MHRLKDLHQAMHPVADVESVKGAHGKVTASAQDLLDALDAEGQEEAE